MFNNFLQMLIVPTQGAPKNLTKYVFNCTQLQMNMMFKPNLTLVNNCNLQGSKSNLLTNSCYNEIIMGSKRNPC
jgi:hypothetical protein